MIARIFAETGVKDLFNLISAMQQIYQDVPKAIRITGNWVPVDPTTWENEYDATVEVGLGYGDKETGITSMQNILGLQEKAMAMSPNAVSYQNSYEAVSELLKFMGYKNTARFFATPDQMAKATTPPSADELKAKQEWDLEIRKLEVRELDVRLTYEVEMAKLGVAARAPQPDPPEPGPPPIQMDLGSMTDAIGELRGATTDMNGKLAGEMAALRATMEKPRVVKRDDGGRVIGSEVGA
jgi:hypothetical protein